MPKGSRHLLAVRVVHDRLLSSSVALSRDQSVALARGAAEGEVRAILGREPY